IPEDVETVALIPVGYPEGKFGPAPRRPVEEVTYYDRWGRSKPRSQA
ncbi:MAG: nitroreductase, partial [Chloroflexi bacterium]|nr:nitroreductase [Chloroflexota bacterium]